MKPPYELVFQGMSHSDALEAAAARHVSRLDRFRQDITHCRIEVVLDEKHHLQGKPFNVRIKVMVPGYELVSSKERHEDVYLALRNAFGNVTRMLGDTARKQRGRGKQRDGRPVGLAARNDAGK
ncbi:ribosome-associated translation inhibitor RaiA [Burkholderia sp. Bp9017]|uniref:HPF/RaiA family ribosome-associated protein n=1 Tax=Burkholderia TaxID=32008 RepID=UPI000F5E69F4|nr:MULTISPECIES: HPF/RaiA family ribosome-associated protein [Burkholderia]MBY4866548.1 HPF/RaiA family ribosome-associated protein [Burkholderia anthina]RQZ23728.1 ribosome-associated translation inhibitor RaiA [Burkholderia sp. Bp9017]